MLIDGHFRRVICKLNGHFREVSMEEKEEVYQITEWGCLSSTLEEYGIDVSYITARVGTHIVEDFMDSLCKAGYVEKKGNEDEQ
jgi:hypothetical protein